MGNSLLPPATGTQFCLKWGPNFESDGDLMVAMGNRFRLFIQTLNNDKKPFNSIFNSKTKSNYSFKEFIHSKTKSNYSFKELFIQTGQNNPA